MQQWVFAKACRQAPPWLRPFALPPAPWYSTLCDDALASAWPAHESSTSAVTSSNHVRLLLICLGAPGDMIARLPGQTHSGIGHAARKHVSRESAGLGRCSI